ncbi:hypothetical protein D3C75_793710 [compost metagenome]
MVGDVLGVGRADADVDQRDAVAVGGDQVVGRHLVTVPDHAGHQGLGFTVVHALFDHHVARQHHAHEARVVTQLVEAVADELVDIAVIVGQQDPRLHMAPVAAGVVHQAAQREVDPRGIEQRQWHDFSTVPVVQAISDVVGGRRQVGAGEHSRQLRSGNAATGQLVALVDHIGIRDVLLADADFYRNSVVMHQRAQLLQQVATERSGLGDGDAVGAGNLDLGIGAGGGGDFAMAVVGQAQCRVAEQVALIGIGLGTVLQVTLQGLTKGTCGLFMQGRQTVDGLFGGINDYKSVAHTVLPVWTCM